MAPYRLISLVGSLSFLISAAVADDSDRIRELFANARKKNAVVTIPPGDYHLDGNASIPLESDTTVNAYGARFHLPISLNDKAKMVLFSAENARNLNWFGGYFEGHVFDPNQPTNKWPPNANTRAIVVSTTSGGSTENLLFRDITSDGLAGAVVSGPDASHAISFAGGGHTLRVEGNTFSGPIRTIPAPVDCQGVLIRDNIGLLNAEEQEKQARVQKVTGLPGLVAFWDFVQRESDGDRRFTAYVPSGEANRYPLDASNYVREYWGKGREATYSDFPQLGRGPFGQAIRIMKETDPDFRPFLFVPRARLHDTRLDIKGAGKSVTVVSWAIRESGNHALAGIWHEGTDLKQNETADISKVQRGQRQYALFAGLNKSGSACGHVSENGASSFLNKYALHKCNSLVQSPEIPADSSTEILDKSWQCFAMTFDHETDELTGWLNGVSGDRWLENPKKDTLLTSAYTAYMQGHFARLPGTQPGEDPSFPNDQYYNPPEKKPIAVQVVSESDSERIERREYGYTKIEVTMQKREDGTCFEATRDLIALRLNPWWYPHDLYTPKDAASGGPFTIGRVIHSSRGVGFTGWIGGVAVFDRALIPAEITELADLRNKVVKTK